MRAHLPQRHLSARRRVCFPVALRRARLTNHKRQFSPILPCFSIFSVYLGSISAFNAISAETAGFSAHMPGHGVAARFLRAGGLALRERQQPGAAGGPGVACRLLALLRLHVIALPGVGDAARGVVQSRVPDQ